jgi:hypothetical protein
MEMKGGEREKEELLMKRAKLDPGLTEPRLDVRKAMGPDDINREAHPGLLLVRW